MVVTLDIFLPTKCEYIERRALLQTESEQARLLKELPEVVPDIQELEDMPDSQIDFQRESQGLKEIPDIHELEDIPNPRIDSRRESNGLKEIPEIIRDIEELENMPNPQIDFQRESMKSHPSEEGIAAKAEDKKSNPFEEAIEAKDEGNKAAFLEKATNDEGWPKSTDMKKRAEEIEVIEIDDDDDDEPPEAMTSTSQASCENPGKKPMGFGEKERIWHYVDPSGREQGPFPMASLGYWKSEGFFDGAFRVWRTGQSRKDAISLKEALLLQNIEN